MYYYIVLTSDTLILDLADVSMNALEWKSKQLMVMYVCKYLWGQPTLQQISVGVQVYIHYHKEDYELRGSIKCMGKLLESINQIYVIAAYVSHVYQFLQHTNPINSNNNPPPQWTKCGSLGQWPQWPERVTICGGGLGEVGWTWCICEGGGESRWAGLSRSREMVAGFPM